MSEAIVPGDERFFPHRGPFTVADLVNCAGVVPTAHDPERRIHRVAPLQVAGPDEVSFLDNQKYISALDATKAGAVIVLPSLLDRVPSGTIGLATPQPYLAWAKIAGLFHPLPDLTAGVHPTAAIDPSAKIDPSCEIGPFVVIAAQAEIGPRCRIQAGAVIGQGVCIGSDARIGSHCSISHALIGDRVTLFPGVRIGQDGFGFASIMTPTGPAHISVPQLGRVLIEHDVEIGANTCVDRGSAQDTVIGAGTRIDNLVQIGHNVRVGKACVLVAQVGIAGSSVLEDFVVLAGQVGVAGHVKIGRGARVGGQAGIMSNLDGGAEYLGSPAMPVKAFFRQQVALKRLAGQGKTTPVVPKAALDGEKGRD
jgi:UDP-3-O-[3-hydroxymyristoyl] glucosamine N-acyltransferase